LDQASSLRNIMIKNEAYRCPFIPVIASSEIEIVGGIVRNIARDYGKKIALIGLNDNKATGASRHARVDEISDDWLLWERAASNEKLFQERLKLIQSWEEKQDAILYFAGKGISSLSVYLSSLASKVLYITKTTQLSELELRKFLNLQKKLGNLVQCKLLIQSDENGAKEFSAKIQKLVEEEKYTVEVVGWYEFRGEEVITELFFDQLFCEDDVLLSSSLI
jgi:hypothetical protein